MKKISILILVLLLTAGFVYRDRVDQWLTKHTGTGLAALNLPKDLIDRLSSNAALFPNPLRSVDESANAYLTRTGTIQQTNAQRKANGNLSALKENALLDKDAKDKLADMFAKQYFEHVSPDGVAPADQADKVGYKYIIVGENLALGNFKDDKALVEAWMNSPGHRANILNSRYQDIGVAVGKGMFEGRETWLAVQEFGTPQSACPGVDSALKKHIDSNEAQINTWAGQLTAMKNALEKNEYPTREEYNRAVGEYNALVAKFNALIDSTKQLVNEYNAQVSSLNACIAA